MSHKVYCEDCVYCKPDQRFLVSLMGMQRSTAMRFALCSHANAQYDSESDKRSYVSRKALEVGPTPTQLYCSVHNPEGECVDYTPKASVLEASFR